MSRVVLIILLNLIFFKPYVFAQENKIDSLKYVLSKSVLERLKPKVLNQLGYEYLHTKPENTLEYINRSIKLASKNNLQVDLINAYILKGIVKKNYGEYDGAANYYFKALKLSEKLSLRDKQSNCLNNIGNIYQAQNDYLKALGYFRESLKIEKSLNNKEHISIRLYNIGVVYEALDSLEQAYTYYFNSLLIEQELKNKEGEYYALYGISGIETKMGVYDKALLSINKALNIAIDINDISGISSCYFQMADLYNKMDKKNQAISFIDSSMLYADKINQKNALRQCYRELALIYNDLDEYKKAYENLSLFSSVNDTINNLEIKNKIAELEARFKIEKKEKEIKYLEKENDLNAKNALNEKRNRYFLLITFLLSIILAVSNLQRIFSDTKTILKYSGIAFIFLVLVTFILFYTGVYQVHITFYDFLKAFIDVLTIAILPIFVFVLMAERILLRKNIRTAETVSQQIQGYKNKEIQTNSSITLNNNKMDVIIALNDIICIEANDNYSAIFYHKENKIKKELFRITLKNLKEQMEDNDDIIRCHKSYIVNIRHIMRISGNAQGYRLHFEELSLEVPVSRKFPKDILQKIKSEI